MAVFTSNQVNHVYVAKAVQATPAVAGDIAVGKTAEGELYFVYKNAMGGSERSDLIKIKNIMWAKAISGTFPSQLRTLKKYTIEAPSTIEDGKTYTVILEMDLHNGVESIYRKTVSVVGRTNDTDFMDRLFAAMEASFGRDTYVNDVFKVVNDGAGVISIIELPQADKYKVGLFANEGVRFKVFSEDDLEINTTGDPMIPLDATEDDVLGNGVATAYTIGNSYNIADLEYFALGERGDKYRLIGWPNAAPSKTLAEVGDAVNYDILNIHFAFTDSNESVQKSEKDITIVADSTTTVINDLLTAIGTAGATVTPSSLSAGDAVSLDIE